MNADGLKREDLLPYSGPGKHCPKCEHYSIDTVWHAGPVSVSRTSRGGPWPCSDSGIRLGEHLCRECESCGYTWAEACADVPPVPLAPVPETGPS